MGCPILKNMECGFVYMRRLWTDIPLQKHSLGVRTRIIMNERKGIGSGLMIGLSLGIIFDNIALGMIFGLMFGAAYDHQQKSKSEEDDSGDAE